MPETATHAATAEDKLGVRIKVNGTTYPREVEPRTLLVESLREACDLTGTHVGCGTSYCGACTVLFTAASDLESAHSSKLVARRYLPITNFAIVANCMFDVPS